MANTISWPLQTHFMPLGIFDMFMFVNIDFLTSIDCVVMVRDEGKSNLWVYEYRLHLQQRGSYCKLSVIVDKLHFAIHVWYSPAF